MNQRQMIVNVALDLWTLSRTEQGRYDYTRAICEAMTDEIAVIPTLQSLAMRAAGTNDLLSAQEVLSVFFDEDAVALLLKAPNRYWFWRLMEVASLVQMSAEPGRFTKRRVQEAAMVLRGFPAFHPLLAHERMEHIRDDANGLREAKIALRAAAGLIVLVPSTDRTKHWLVDNPIFFDPVFEPE